MSDWTAAAQPDLADAMAEFRVSLPGWWFSLGECSVSADASCGPDRCGVDAHLLKQPLFDGGFHADLDQPATLAEALRGVTQQALEAKAIELTQE